MTLAVFIGLCACFYHYFINPFTTLEQQLQEYKWIDACETTSLILASLMEKNINNGIFIKRHKNPLKSFPIEAVDNISLEKIRAIDRLWLKYSGGQFGFSVQAAIYSKYPCSKMSIKSRNMTIGLELKDNLVIKAYEVRDWGQWNYYEDLIDDEKKALVEMGLMNYSLTSWGTMGNIHNFWNSDRGKEIRDISTSDRRSQRKSLLDDASKAPKGFFPIIEGYNNSLFQPILLLLWRKILRGSCLD